MSLGSLLQLPAELQLKIWQYVLDSINESINDSHLGVLVCRRHDLKDLMRKLDGYDIRNPFLRGEVRNSDFPALCGLGMIYVSRTGHGNYIHSNYCVEPSCEMNMPKGCTKFLLNRTMLLSNGTGHDLDFVMLLSRDTALSSLLHICRQDRRLFLESLLRRVQTRAIMERDTSIRRREMGRSGFPNKSKRDMALIILEKLLGLSKQGAQAAPS